MRVLKAVAFVCAWLVMVPTSAFAQASIAGVVKDTSGAVLPGVTVEASSPALIEKTRSAVTDGSGLYRIVDLRPGTYSMTFTLLGFTTVKREGVERCPDRKDKVGDDGWQRSVPDHRSATGHLRGGVHTGRFSDLQA